MPLGIFLLMSMYGCAANPSPDASSPRADEPAYPILLADSNGDMRNDALVQWTAFARRNGIAAISTPDLHPVTATLRSIPTLDKASLYLPKVGQGPAMSEEEMRESLRRFIAEAGSLLCGDPQQLSLVARVDGADRLQEARYEQRAFRYPLRHGFGELKIRFRPDRRIIGLSSTCITETERVKRGLTGLGQPRIGREQAMLELVDRTVNYIGADGHSQVYVISSKDKLTPGDLVIFPIMTQGDQPFIEFHIAWEFIVEANPGMAVYIDSINGELLGTDVVPRS
jgi:hypothetical protein